MLGAVNQYAFAMAHSDKAGAQTSILASAPRIAHSNLADAL